MMRVVRGVVGAVVGVTLMAMAGPMVLADGVPQAGSAGSAGVAPPAGWTPPTLWLAPRVVPVPVASWPAAASGSSAVGSVVPQAGSAASGSALHGYSRAPWAGSALRMLVVQGVLRGVGGGQIQPNGNVTRAEVATMLGRLLGWSTPAHGSAAVSVYTDQAAIPAWARADVQAAYAKHIMLGVGGGRFDAGGLVTWAQAAEVIDRAFAFAAVPPAQVRAELAPLPRGTATPSWAQAAAAADESAGLFTGLLGQVYLPSQPISRAELAVLLQRAEQLRPAAVARGAPVAPRVLPAPTVPGPVSGTVAAVTAGSVTIGSTAYYLDGSAAVAREAATVAVGDRLTLTLDAAGQVTGIQVLAGGVSGGFLGGNPGNPAP